MEDELRQDPGSWVANYWLAVALRGTGDVEGAWHARIAAWVRSTLSPETTAELRADLDRLVMQALIPERSRVMAVRDPQEAVSPCGPSGISSSSSGNRSVNSRLLDLL